MGVHPSVPALVKSSAGDKTIFYPLATIRCEGTPAFGSQMARDLGCLLDLDPQVSSWRCLAVDLHVNGTSHIPDFSVDIGGKPTLIDVGVAPELPFAAISEAARSVGFSYRRISAQEIYSGFRLKNARDLLRYGRYHCPLGDRIRLLHALDEHGSLTIAECLPAFREAVAIPSLASLVLHRFVDIDLDAALLGPETQVRRSAN